MLSKFFGGPWSVAGGADASIASALSDFSCDPRKGSMFSFLWVPADTHGGWGGTLALFLQALLALSYLLILHSQGKFVLNTSGLPGWGLISITVLAIESGGCIPCTSCVTGMNFPPSPQLHGSGDLSDGAIPHPSDADCGLLPLCLGEKWTWRPVAGGSSSWWNFLTTVRCGPWLHNQTRNRAETRFHQAHRFVRIFMTQIELQMLSVLT